MRTEVDVAMADPDASTDELRRMGEAVRETVDRCERLIESLLMLARSEAATGREEPVDLAGAGRRLHHRPARPRPGGRGQRARTTWSRRGSRGEPGLLERMIANLLDNGIRHNEPRRVPAGRHAHPDSRRRAGRPQRRRADRPRRGSDADRAVPAAGPLLRWLRAGPVDRALGRARFTAAPPRSSPRMPADSRCGSIFRGCRASSTRQPRRPARFLRKAEGPGLSAYANLTKAAVEPW